MGLTEIAETVRVVKDDLEFSRVFYTSRQSDETIRLHALLLETDQNQQFVAKHFDDLLEIYVGSGSQLHLAIAGNDVLYRVEGEPTAELMTFKSCGVTSKLSQTDSGAECMSCPAESPFAGGFNS